MFAYIAQNNFLVTAIMLHVGAPFAWEIDKIMQIKG